MKNMKKKAKRREKISRERHPNKIFLLKISMKNVSKILIDPKNVEIYTYQVVTYIFFFFFDFIFERQ